MHYCYVLYRWQNKTAGWIPDCAHTAVNSSQFEFIINKELNGVFKEKMQQH